MFHCLIPNDKDGLSLATGSLPSSNCSSLKRPRPELDHTVQYGVTAHP